MKPPPFVVHPSGRYLARSDGTPFFYLADTAWEIFHRANLEEADHYFRIRGEQGFTVMQATVLPEFGGLHVPNYYGERPLHDDDPARPNDAYFKHVDMLLDRAAWNGLTVALLPTWGDKWHRIHDLWGAKVIFTPENALAYGRWIGTRYAERDNVIWVLGGDRPVGNDTHREINRALAHGLREGDGGRHLITFHPYGGRSSAEDFHNEPWLDFNMLQSGHTGHDFGNHAMIERDYARQPVKPCLDAEPCYEDHPVMGAKWSHEASDWFDAFEVRKRAYWAVFAGAFGHAYGAHSVWQWWDEARERVNHVRTPWREALQLPGAKQMRHLRALMESRPFFERIPDQSLLTQPADERGSHRRATRAADGSYAFIYSPDGQAFAVGLTALSGEQLTTGWFNPRTGKFTANGTQPQTGVATFTPPEAGFDWVLVIDDARRNFPAPGPAPQ
jgi:hypothetical protein